MIGHDHLPSIGEELGKLGIEAGIVVGGSYSYKHDQIESLHNIRDLDLIVVVDTRKHLVELLSKHNNDLERILRLEKTDKQFSKDDLWPFEEGAVGGVRYSGTSSFGQKLSVKLIPRALLESAYDDDGPHAIDILSKKDRRFYPKKDFSGAVFHLGVMNQRTSDDLVILGDPDIFTVRGGFSLGVVSDVLLSGRIVHDSPAIGVALLQDKLIDKIKRLFGTLDYSSKDWSSIFVRSDCFPKDFKDYLNERFSKTIVDHSPGGKKEGVSGTTAPKYGVHVVPHIVGRHCPQFRLRDRVGSKIRDCVYVEPGPFSSNSNHGRATFDNGEAAFFKEMRDDARFRGEIFGAMTASAYYPHMQEPLFTDPGRNLVAYPWRSGDVLASKRLSPASDESIPPLMELELRRAGDALNAFVLSASDVSRGLAKKEDLYLSRIHDLFYGRLVGGRLREFYGSYGASLGKEETPFSELLNLTPIINRMRYPSLGESLRVAIENLDPERLAGGPLVCGLGDAHSGNIMHGDSPDDYLYVDYEFAGFHSPYLDVAKPLYNDVSFDLFYSDRKPLPPDVEILVERKGNDLVIEHNYAPDALSRYLLKTKVDGIIKPMHAALSDVGVIDDGGWWRTLGSAMVCCGLLTRDLTKFSAAGFWLNLANVVEMAEMQSYYDRITGSQTI